MHIIINFFHPWFYPLKVSEKIRGEAENKIKLLNIKVNPSRREHWRTLPLR